MKALLHRWIVLYNPFYFAGSLFLLTGVMLLQRQTVGAAYDWKYIFLGTFAALQSYELCLIALAAWLHRCKGMRRPAVILALLECLFLIDPTLSGQLVAHLEPMDVWLGLAWAGLLPLKLAGLVWALKLRLPTFDAMTLGTTLQAIQTVPLVLDSRRLEPESVVAFCVWGFAALLIYCHTRDGFGMVAEPSTDDRNREWFTTVATRIRRAVGIGLVVAVLGHIAIWITVFDLEVPARHMVPVLLALAWIGSGNLLTWGAALAAPTFVTAQWLPITLFVLAGLFVFLATMRNPVLHCTAAWTFTYLGTLETLDYFTLRSAADWPAHLVFVLGSIISAWLLRHGLPLAPAAVVVAVGCSQLKFEPLTVGVALIALAFTSLGLGTWLTSRWGAEKTQAIGTSDSL